MEYEALDSNFHDRGIRSEEQIELLRQLWEEDAITFEGHWHKVTDAGLNPLPPENIPIWLGGMAPQVIDRVARIGDGWFPFASPDLPEQIKRLHTKAKEARRDPMSIGIECILPSNIDVDRIKALEELGVTHVTMLTMNQNLSSPQEHIDAIKASREKLAAAFG